MSVPTVMISSTFYDLRQLRTDLAEFLGKELGYTPLLSELPSFPIDPDLTTVENCRRVVSERADIFVLIIGGRYGAIPVGHDLSVTNIEYLAARAKAIPTFVFVDKSVLALLPVWEQNPNGNFESVTDTPRLFEFVKNIRSHSGVWTFSFESAQDIIGVLRFQIANLLGDALQLRTRLSASPHKGLINSVSPAAARLVLERPVGWEYRLFFQAWADSVEKRRDLLSGFDTQLLHGSAETVTAPEAVVWFQTRMGELQALVGSANNLIGVSAQKAFGPPGEPGDPDLIVWSASELGDLLETAIRWAQRIARAHVEPPYDEIAREMVHFPDQVIERLRNFPSEVIPTIQEHLAAAAAGATTRHTFTVVFELRNAERYLAAMNRAQRRLESGEFRV